MASLLASRFFPGATVVFCIATAGNPEYIVIAGSGTSEIAIRLAHMLAAGDGRHFNAMVPSSNPNTGRVCPC